MDRYEKLYAAVDKVFAGTPNTPSALAAKTEILENLTAKYEDLLSEGLSEEEAVRQVVESIGDIGELFGMEPQNIVTKSERKEIAKASDESTKGKESTAGALPAGGAPKIKIPSLYPPEKVERGRVIQKTLIAVAVALYILSVAAPTLSMAGLPDTVAVAAMFVIWGLATAMIVGSGICLPWSNPTGKLLLSLGVGGYIWAFAPMIILADYSEGLAISLMFGGWALATLLVIFSTNFKRKGLPTAEGKRIIIEPVRPGELPPDLQGIYKPISTVLTMFTLVIYLAVSFWTFGWVYTWLIWVIHGCVCDIVKAICWLFYKARRDS